MKRMLILAAGAILVAGCAALLTDGEAQQRAEQIFREGFSKGNPQITARVRQQDEVQMLCSKYRNEPPREIAEKIEKSQRATIRYPASGRLMGDWRNGEEIAQDGWGQRFTDKGQPKRLNGGNCYACHQLAPQELSYGTMGPNLHRFGKLRGTSEAIQRYTYGRIYNSQAFTACSSMPRLGHNEVLTPEQIADVVALLLDPRSPVNQ